MKNKILLPTIGLAILGASVFGVSSTFAQSTTDPASSLVERIATKFSLNKTDVQAVFDEEHSARQAEMQKRQDDRLTQLVTEGKLTAAQKTALQEKMKEMQAKKDASMESMKNMTPEERKTAMQTERESLETWAKAQGIDLKTVMGGMGKGFGMHGGRMRDDSSPKPTVAQ